MTEARHQVPSPRWLDAPGPVRAGEEIDGARLREYFSGALPELGTGPVTVEQFPSGYSNLTYLVRVGDRAVILRRPPIGVAIATAHDMAREYRILSGVRPVWPKVPEALAFCDDTTVLGAPFYVMERVEGVIFRKGVPESMIPEPELAARIAGELVTTLVELHEVDVAAAGLSDFGRPDGYVRRQVEGWTKRYRHAETDRVLQADEVAAWLAASMPPRSDATLIHNDFKHDNVVLDAEGWSKVVAVLDWEMATLGDPLMDLGTSLAYWVQPGDPAEVLATRLSPTTWPGTPSRSEIVELYARLSGRDVHDIVFYYAFGLFKVAVIVQQLYARYVSGRTTDPRYAGLIEGVRALSGLASQAIERGRIDDLH